MRPAHQEHRHAAGQVTGHVRGLLTLVSSISIPFFYSRAALNTAGYHSVTLQTERPVGSAILKRPPDYPVFKGPDNLAEYPDPFTVHPLPFSAIGAERSRWYGTGSKL